MLEMKLDEAKRKLHTIIRETQDLEEKIETQKRTLRENLSRESK